MRAGCRAAGLAAWLFLGAGVSAGWAQSLVLASTTSTEQSGLFAHLLPAFTQATGVAVKVVAVGTGQALELARRGDADVVLVHDPEAEDRFVAEGWATRKYAVMANDFVLLGPQADPARVRGHDAAAAFVRLARGQSAFVSRGDRSGTHATELRLWAMDKIAVPYGESYQACGCGMGQALTIAAAKGAYVLADRGTWLTFKNRADLQVLVQGDKRLTNPYSVMLVNPARHAHVKVAQGQRLIDWLIGPAGQAAIAAYKVQGEQLFYPTAGK